MVQVATHRRWMRSRRGLALSHESGKRPRSYSLSSITARISGGMSFKITFNNELWTFSSPLYSMKPSLLNLFMNTLTRERVVPIISARVSWLNFAMTGSVFPSLPKLAISNRTRANLFSLELKS